MTVFSCITVDRGGQAKGITMADIKQGTYDPKKGGKFEPTTKAQPAPLARPGDKK